MTNAIVFDEPHLKRDRMIRGVYRRLQGPVPVFRTFFGFMP